MGRFADRVRGGDPAEIATHGLGGLEGGKLAAVLSLFALLMSAYSMGAMGVAKQLFTDTK